MLGLLADSKHTKRYSKLQDFIQRGADKAKITVTLKNEGEDAYKPEVYGTSISFQRTIWSSGQSSVNILDQDETIIRKNREAREEGKRILESFRIHTDNPIAILQQEEAKELLKVESPGSLYTFFQKATLLKQCMEQYTAATEQLDRTKEAIKTKKIAHQEIKNKFLQKKKKYDEFIKTREWEADEKRLSQEYVVSLGNDKLLEIEGKEVELLNKKKSEEGAKVKVKELNKDNGDLMKKKLEVEVKLDDERKKYADQEVNLQDLKLAIDQLRNQEKDHAKELKGLGEQKKIVEGEIGIYEDQIRTLSSANSAAARKEAERKRREQLEENDMKMNQINDDIEALGIERESVDTSIEQNKKALDLAEYERRSVATKLSNLEKELKDMRSSQTSKLATFDILAPQVAAEIRKAEQQNKFKVRPIGPVGSFIKLTQEAASSPDLARLIETELGGPILRCYLCNEDSDRRTLWDIFSRVYGNKKKPNIFTSKFLNQKHNVQRVQGHKTVMDFVEIDGSPQEAVVVFNHLVDQRSIETVVVTKTQDEAKKLCTFIDNVPKNLNYVITHDFNKFHPPSKYASYRSYFIDPIKSQVLGSNMNTKMIEKQADIERSRADLQRLAELRKEKERIKCKLEADNIVIREKITKHHGTLAMLRAEKSKLMAEEDPAETCDTVTEKLELKRKEIEGIMEKQEKTIDLKKNVNDNIKSATADYNNLLKKVTAMREVTTPLESELSNFEVILPFIFFTYLLSLFTFL